jgi:Flp pilus assembly protein TadD/4-amino-4-deoxy-L-arabinose transferase-like glycosyltransferase
MSPEQETQHEPQVAPSGPPVATRPHRALVDVALFVGVCALALIIRLAYLAQARDVPFFHDLLVDARRYADWGRQIAAGDWLGQGVFFQAPLYPYFLASVFKLLGDDLGRLYVVQAIVGALGCGILFAAGRGFVSRGVGLAAAVLLALNGPAIFFDGLIQKTVLATFLLAVLLWLLAVSLRRPSWWLFGVTGMTLGLLSLVRENARILVVVLALWILIHFAAYARRRFGWAGILFLGSALVLLPVGLRNYLVGGQFVLSSSQAGANFYIGNNPQARGFYIPLVPGEHNPGQEEANARLLAERALGRELTPKEVSDFWMRRAWDYIRARPAAWLALMLRKCGLVWNAYEVPDANDYYFYQQYSSVLRLLGRVDHFGVISPLAAAGLVLTWRRRRDLWVLYALLLTMTVATALFFIFARYRFPLVPILCIFAGAGLVEGWRFVRRGDVRVVALLGLVVGVGVLANWPLPEAQDMRALSYANYGAVLAQEGKTAEAVEQYRRALALVPDDAQGQYDMGMLLMKLGRYDEAVAHFRAAAEADPGFVMAYNRWGVALGMQGRFDEAVRCFERALQIKPDHFESYNDLGFALASAGRLGEAEQAYLRATVLNPKSEQATANLYWVYIARGKYGAAVQLLRRATEEIPDSVALQESLIWLLAACPDPRVRAPQEAVARAERLCEATGYQEPRLLEALAGAYAAAGRFEQAVNTVHKALDILGDSGPKEAVEALREDLRNYEAGIAPSEVLPEPGPASTGANQQE